MILVILALETLERLIEVVVVAVRTWLSLDQNRPCRNSSSEWVKVEHLHFRGIFLAFDFMLRRNLDIDRKKVGHAEPTIREIRIWWIGSAALSEVIAQASRVVKLELVA